MKKIIHKGVDEILGGISEWLIEQNKELIDNENLEDYVECQSIKESIDNFLEVNAEILFLTGAFKANKTKDDIKIALNNENIYIFNELKNTQYENE